MRHLGQALAMTLLLPVAAVLLQALPAAADSPTTLTLRAPAAVRPGTNVPIAATLLRSADGSPISAANITFERLGADHTTWSLIASATTDAAGTATVDVTASGTELDVRARFDGTTADAPATSGTATIAVRRVPSALRVAGPHAIVDERSGRFTLAWTGADGAAVSGPVTVYQHVRGRAWSRLATMGTDGSGRLSLVVRPRVDTWYRFVGSAGTGWLQPASRDWYVDNRPPRHPVVLPRYAPRPAHLRAQPRAVGTDANVVVRRIPSPVWNRMNGVSWRPGCLPRSSLRYLQTNYWGFDGYRHRGELVVRGDISYKFVTAMRRLYAAGVPIRAMYLPDRFGYNQRSGGANDFASMRHDNSSAFNCRWVTGSPGRRSPHATGRSIDLNPFENPFRSSAGWLPNSWWAHHKVGLYTWRSSGDTVVRIMRSAGFHWTYGSFDSQHFDGRFVTNPVGD